MSFNYLRHLYQIGEINNNRIIVNAMQSTQPNIKQRAYIDSTSKIVHFYKYESEISLEQGRAFTVSRRGQIQEIDLKRLNEKQADDEQLGFYIKNIEKMLNIEAQTKSRKATTMHSSSHLNKYNKQRSLNTFESKINKFSGVSQSNYHGGGGTN